MKTRIFLSIATTLSLTVPAWATDGDRADVLLQLIRDNGCQMTSAEADQMLPEHGFDMSQTRDIVRGWAKDGMVDMNGFAGIKLSEKGCKS
ncbi:hypothetical protein [Shimia biformata]|uniref:hypothetical protein n=1 Tax=Shimia biformata TaxID=1294299 RepID=UPI00194DBD74|nr:hypothetical protein [Shimia biformata]